MLNFPECFTLQMKLHSISLQFNYAVLREYEKTESFNDNFAKPMVSQKRVEIMIIAKIEGRFDVLCVTGIMFGNV